MTPIYILVHYEPHLTTGVFLPEDTENSVDCITFSPEFSVQRIPGGRVTIKGILCNPIRKELTRIIKNEEYLRVDGDASLVPPHLPKDRLLRVCGQWWKLCVQAQHQALQKAGYQSEAYRPASLDSEDIPDY